MKKILFVSAYQIFPPQSGGHLRIANTIMALKAAGADVRLYSMSSRAKDYASGLSSSEKEVAPGVYEFVDRRIGNRLAQGLSGRLHIPPLWQYFSAKHFKFLNEFYELLAWCDAVIINHFYLYPIFSLAPHAQHIINSHNLEHLGWRGNLWHRLFSSPLVKRIESRVGYFADEIHCCAPDEVEFFRRHSSEQTKILSVPNGLFPKLYQRQADQRSRIRKLLDIKADERLILFVGSRYVPNVEAYDFLKSFAQSHAEWLSAHKLKFLVVGSVASKPFSSASLVATSFVDEVIPYIHAADLAINPVVSGSGTNVKVFEYIAARLPLLSTVFGRRGIDLDNGTDYYEFAWDDLLSVLKNSLIKASPEQLGAMAESAFKKNQPIIDMDKIAQDLLQIKRAFKLS